MSCESRQGTMNVETSMAEQTHYCLRDTSMGLVQIKDQNKQNRELSRQPETGGTAVASTAAWIIQTYLGEPHPRIH